MSEQAAGGLHWQDQSPDERWVAQQSNYEEQVVKFILKKRNWGSETAAAIKSYSDRAGLGSTLTAAGLAAATTFPLRLGTAKLPHITKETFFEMQVRPTKTPVFAAFYSLCEQFPDAASAGRLGLVFHWTGLSSFVLFHVYDRPLQCVGSRWVWHPGRNKQAHILETLESFLEATDPTHIIDQ